MFGRAKEKKIEKALTDYFSVISAYSPVFTTFAGGIYEMELTRAAIHSFAVHCSKLKPEVVGAYKEPLERILQFQPNPIMDTSKYLYRLATAYMTDNNVIIAPIEKYGEIRGFYPLIGGKTELRELDGKTYVRYDMGGGQYFAVEFEKCGIMNQYQYRSELWGESNRCLRPTMELINAQNQGIIEGIKSSAAIRFIARLAGSLKPKDIEEEKKRLVKENLEPENSGGIFLVDQKYADVKQIESRPMIVEPAQMQQIKENVYTYFGTNEFILQNKYTPDQWNAYYEGKIEPFALQAGLVHTNMRFSEREKAHGNQIFFSTNRLQYASIADKINFVVQMGDRGRTSIDEDREVFNLPPLPDGKGNVYFIRGEYKTIEEQKERVESNADEEGKTVQGNNDDSGTDGDGRNEEASAG